MQIERYSRRMFISTLMACVISPILGCSETATEKTDRDNTIVAYNASEHLYLKDVAFARRHSELAKMTDIGLSQYVSLYETAQADEQRAAFLDCYTMVEDSKDGVWFPGVVVTSALMATNEDGDSFLVVDCCEMTGAIDVVEVVVFRRDIGENVRVVSSGPVWPPHLDSFNTGFTCEINLVPSEMFEKGIASTGKAVYASEERMVLPALTDDVVMAVRLKNRAGIWSRLTPVNTMQKEGRESNK